MKRALAGALLAGSLLPLAEWIPSGERDAAAAARATDWLLGFALCGGLGLLAWLLRRHTALDAEPPSAELPFEAERRRAIIIAVAALGLYVVIALGVFSGRPLLIDEIVQVLQAQDFARGQLTHDIPGPRPFFAILHEVDFGARAYGQYPAGGPAMLTLGVLIGAPWLVGPLAGAASVWLFWLLLRAFEPRATPRFRLFTTLVFAVTPFAAFMFGSHMNHATVLPWLLLATLGLGRAVQASGARWRWGLITGLALGIAATIRPLDAAAFALPAAAWLAWQARKGGVALVALLLSGVGVAIPMAAAFWVNVQTTGHPLHFGYDLLWGAGHRLGFHETPWGSVHTPQRGLELIGLYLARLNTYLFELPFPSLLLPALGLWWAPRLRTLDHYALASAALVALGYWAYWHDGFFLGPRFLFAWTPLLVLWSARGVRALDGRVAPRPGGRAALWTAGAAALGLALISVTFVRLPTYRNGLRSMRFSTTAAEQAGVRGALVLVKESWGAQLVARLWELGITRPDAEVLYRTVDACVLDEALRHLAQEGRRDAAALARLRPLMVDSSRLVASDLSPDFTEKRLPGLAYTPTCIARIEDDRRGYLLYAPWRLLRDGNIYARWLPGREAEIAAHFPGRPLYRLERAGPAVDAPLRWVPMER